MKHISTLALLCLASCTTVQPTIEPYLSPQVEKSYDSMQVAANPVDPDLLKGEAISAAPIASAGKDDTLYFPAREITLAGKCSAGMMKWQALRTSLPTLSANGKIDIYRIFIDYRLTCSNSSGTGVDDKRITLIWAPKDVLATLDAGKMGTWAITNDGTPAVVFKSGN